MSFTFMHEVVTDFLCNGYTKKIVSRGKRREISDEAPKISHPQPTTQPATHTRLPAPRTEMLPPMPRVVPVTSNSFDSIGLSRLESTRCDLSAENMVIRLSSRELYQFLPFRTSRSWIWTYWRRLRSVWCSISQFKLN